MTPAQIAAGLSEAQRKMVLASGPDDITGREGFGVEIRGSDYRVARVLRTLGIGGYTHGSPYFDMYWNNAEGLAVRAILNQDGEK